MSSFSICRVLSVRRVLFRPQRTTTLFQLNHSFVCSPAFQPISFSSNSTLVSDVLNLCFITSFCPLIISSFAFYIQFSNLIYEL